MLELFSLGELGETELPVTLLELKDRSCQTKGPPSAQDMGGNSPPLRYSLLIL